MNYRSLIVVLALVAGSAVPLVAQTEEIKLDAAQSKVTTVSAMRARKAPQVKAEEVMRLKLGTVVNAVAHSTTQDIIGGKTDFWYRITLPNGESGWVFGGLLLNYDPRQRSELLRQIIEARLKAENTDFQDRGEIYELAGSAFGEAKDVNMRAEFELLKLLALANWAAAFPDNLRDKSPYREWLKAYGAEVIQDEFAGGYSLRSEVLWNLERKYHAVPIAERIAWEAAQNPQPSDCEGDEVCHFFGAAPTIKYLGLYPNGAHAAEALNNINDVLTDQVISEANAKGGDKYVIQARTDLTKELASLRLALAKVSAPEKSGLLEKLKKLK